MMRIAVSTVFAAACYASSLPGDQQGVIAPDAKSQELKELLALDSFNVTSSDAEQNRMHAVCDMEYRLSKTSAVASKKGVGINNLLVTPAPAQFPWNPFTMPIAAVTAHIALLQQELTYLQAQSDAFEGTSSDSSSSSDLITMSKVYNAVDSAPGVALTARDATAGVIAAEFSLNSDLEAEDVIKMYATTSEAANTADSAVALFTTTGTITAFTTGIQTVSGTDGNAKYTDDTTTTWVANTLQLALAASDTRCPGGLDSVTYAVALAAAQPATTKCLRQTFVLDSTTKLLKADTKLRAIIGGGSAAVGRTATVANLESVTIKIFKADGTVKGTATMDVTGEA